VALAGAGEVVGGGFEEDTTESEAARLVDDGADEEGGGTETEEKIFEGCYYIKNSKLAPGTHYSRGYRGRQRSGGRSALSQGGGGDRRRYQGSRLGGCTRDYSALPHDFHQRFTP
jgi:hypothetical protein